MDRPNSPHRVHRVSVLPATRHMSQKPSSGSSYVRYTIRLITTAIYIMLQLSKPFVSILSETGLHNAADDLDNKRKTGSAVG